MPEIETYNVEFSPLGVQIFIAGFNGVSYTITYVKLRANDLSLGFTNRWKLSNNYANFK